MTQPHSHRKGARKDRTALPLATRLDKHLFAYAAAASAAGVGLLASAQSAQAKIVYTHAKIPITVDGGNVTIDLNHDGIADFGLSNYYNTFAPHHNEGAHQGGVTVGGSQANNAIVQASSKGNVCAAALKGGVAVGAKQTFSTKPLVMAWSGGSYTNGGSAFGPWLGVKQAYLGFKFYIKGKIHYGWVRIQWHGVGQNEYITGYAYETIANKSLLTGKEKSTDAPVETAGATLGSLDRGASSLPAGRNK
jgi:hypothetical protein